MENTDFCSSNLCFIPSKPFVLWIPLLPLLFCLKLFSPFLLRSVGVKVWILYTAMHRKKKVKQLSPNTSAGGGTVGIGRQMWLLLVWFPGRTSELGAVGKQFFQPVLFLILCNSELGCRIQQSVLELGKQKDERWGFAYHYFLERIVKTAKIATSLMCSEAIFNPYPWKWWKSKSSLIFDEAKHTSCVKSTYLDDRLFRDPTCTTVEYSL